MKKSALKCKVNAHGWVDGATRPVTPEPSRFTGSQLPKWSRKHAGQRVSARSGEEKPGGEKEFGERKLHSAAADVVTVGEMDQKNRSEHNYHAADGSDSEQHSEQDGQASGKLSEADQIAYDCRLMHERGKVLWAGTSKCSEQYRAAVIEKRHRASDAHDEEFKVQFPRDSGGDSAWRAHKNLP